MLNGCVEFQRRHLKTSEKTAKKNVALEKKVQARQAVEDNPNNIPIAGAPIGGPPKKKVYTPFPPPQPPSKLDLQMASGEYFLKNKEKESIEKRKWEERQQAKAVVKKATREEAFIAPPESVEASVLEKKKKRKRHEGGEEA